MLHIDNASRTSSLAFHSFRVVQAGLLLVALLLSPLVQADTPACGKNLKDNTRLDADMNCAGIALFLFGKASSNVTLNCAGHAITTDDDIAIIAQGVSGITIKNCNISTSATFGHGIRARFVNNSTIKNNVIVTAGARARGIDLRQSSDNKITGNRISTAGDAEANAIRMRIQANRNLVSDNSLQADSSYPIEIESSDNNRIRENTLVSPRGYLSVHSLRLQNGGFAIDDSGNFYALENNEGSSRSNAMFTSLFALDPATGLPLWTTHIFEPGPYGSEYLDIGFDALDIPPGGPMMALPACCQSTTPTLYRIEFGEIHPLPLTMISGTGQMNGLEAISNFTMLATSSSGELLNIDLLSGEVNLIGKQAIGWTDLAIHPTDGKAYTVSRRKIEASNTSHLYEIDLTTGEVVTEIGDTGEVMLSDIDFAPDGTLYGNNGSLLIINTADASVTRVSSAGFGSDPADIWPHKNKIQGNLFKTIDGSVRIADNITLPTATDTHISATLVEINPNKVTIDSAMLPFLDEPARIWLHNLTGSYRNLLVDPEDDGSFLPCAAPRCEFVSFLDGTLIFDVDGFSSYSSEENAAPTLEFVTRITQAQIKALQQDPGASQKTKKKLKTAAGHVSTALKMINRDKLKRAFVKMAGTASALAKAGNELADANLLVDNLVDSVRAEAQAAIDEAIATGGVSTFVTDAGAHMSTAQSLRDADKPDEAILAYKKAWGNARQGISYQVGGRLQGLTGGSIMLRQNDGDDLVLTADGDFSFATLLPGGSDYRVTIPTQPHSPHHDCKVKQGKGNIASSDITSIVVTCAAVPGWFAYVGNADTKLVNSFSVNPANGELMEVLPAATAGAAEASSIAMDPSGRIIYLASLESGTIDTFRIDPDSGALTKAGKSLSLGSLSTSIAVGPSGRFAYVVKLDTGKIASFEINPDNGKLTQVGPELTAGIGSFSVVVDPTGRFVYVTSSGAGAGIDETVSAYEIDPELGTLTAAGTPVATGNHPFSIAVHPTARFAYVTNLMSGDVTSFGIDPGTGALTEIGSEIAAGTGARSIALDPSGRFAYVINQTSNDISSFSIDPVSGALSEIGAEIATALFPTSIAVGPTGRFVFVSNGDSDNVMTYSIHPETGALYATGNDIVTGPMPFSLALGPPKRFAYVANGNSDSLDIYSIDPRNGKLIAEGSVATGAGPLSVTVDPGGRFAYAANIADNTVSSFSIHPQSGALTEVGAAVATGLNPLSVSVDPSGRFAYVTNVSSNDITSFSIDSTTGALTETDSEVAAGDAPNSLSIEPTGRFAYVANVLGNDIISFSIDPVSGALSQMGSGVAAGAAPRGLTIHPSGRFAYVANQNSNDVTSFSIDLVSGALTEIGTEIAAGDAPKAVTVHPNGRFAYVTNEASDDVTSFSIDPVSGALTEVGSEVAAGDAPRAIAVDPTGRFAYVTNFESNDVTRFSIDPVSGALTRQGKEIGAGNGPHSITIIGGSH
jgi:6-phosphogluconolactonase (cycloisomerase 2 family)